MKKELIDQIMECIKWCQENNKSYGLYVGKVQIYGSNEVTAKRMKYRTVAELKQIRNDILEKVIYA